MEKYLNTRNDKIVTVLKKQGGQVVIQDESGQQAKITEGNLKRWYKKVEDSVEPEEVPVEATENEAVQAPMVEETPVEEIKSTKSKPVKEKKVKEPKEPKVKKTSVAGNHPLADYVKAHAINEGFEVSVNETVKCLMNVKKGKSHILPLTFNTRGVVLWTKEEIAKELGIDCKYTSHTYNARIPLTTDDEASRAIVDKVLKAANTFVEAKLANKETEKLAKSSKKAKKENN